MDRVRIGNQIIGQVTVTVHGTTQSAVYCGMLSFLNMLCFHHFSGNGFRQWMFPLLWVPELSLCLSHYSSQLSKSFPLQTRSLHAIWECGLFTSEVKCTHSEPNLNSKCLLSIGFPFITSRCEPFTVFVLLSISGHCWLFIGRCLAPCVRACARAPLEVSHDSHGHAYRLQGR
jgi:hypothetical protein